MDSFGKRGISAASVTFDCCEKTKTGVVEGRYQLVFIQLMCSEKFRSMCENEFYVERLIVLVIDEVHCDKEWLLNELKLIQMYQRCQGGCTQMRVTACM